MTVNYTVKEEGKDAVTGSTAQAETKVEAGKTTTADFADNFKKEAAPEKKGTLVITKTTDDEDITSQELNDALKFTVKVTVDENGEKVTKYLDKDGNLTEQKVELTLKDGGFEKKDGKYTKTFENVEPGEYTVEVTNSLLPGYVSSTSSSVSGTVEGSDETTTLEVNDLYQKFSVKTVLVDVSKNNSRLPGGKFQLKDSNGNVIDEWTSDTNTREFTKLLIGGTYTIHETDTPVGYEGEPNGDLTFVVNQDGTTSIVTNTGLKETNGTIDILNAPTGYLWGSALPQRYTTQTAATPSTENPNTAANDSTAGTDTNGTSDKKNSKKKNSKKNKSENNGSGSSVTGNQDNKKAPAPTGSTASVRTADTTPVLLWLSILVAALGVILAYVLVFRRRHSGVRK